MKLCRDLKPSFRLLTRPLRLSEHPYWHGFTNFIFGVFMGDGWKWGFQRQGKESSENLHVNYKVVQTCLCNNLQCRAYPKSIKQSLLEWSSVHAINYVDVEGCFLPLLLSAENHTRYSNRQSSPHSLWCTRCPCSPAGGEDRRKWGNTISSKLKIVFLSVDPPFFSPAHLTGTLLIVF